MNILDAFYNHTYENGINKKMLYYNYDFPTEKVEEYICELLSVPIDKFVQYNIESETIEPITPKDVFQFSSLDAGTIGICSVLSEAGNPGVTFIEAGKMLLNDGIIRKDAAYIKYGENHLKTAEALGLLYELTRTYFVSCIGVTYLTLSDEARRKLTTRLLLRNKLIVRLVKASAIATVDARQFLYMLSDSTYTRRKSNLKCIIAYMQESKEYDFSTFANRIFFA